MVFYPPGIRPNSSRADPTESIPAAPGTYTCHAKVATSHGKTILMRPNDVPLPMRWTVMQQSVQNYDANAFCRQADSNFDVLLVGAPVHSLEDIYLHFYVVNTNAVGGNPVKMMHAVTIFNRQDVQLNGSFTDETIYQEQMYQDYNDWLENDHERIGRAPYVNGETASMVTNAGNDPSTYVMWDASDNAIPPQGQIELFVPLINCLTDAGPWLPRKMVDPRVRIYGALNPILSTNAAGDLTGTPLRFTGMETLITGIVFDPAARMRISQYYAQAPVLHRCIIHDRFLKDMGGWQVGNYLGDAQLTPFTGQYASINFWFNRKDPNVTRELLVYGSNRTSTAATRNPLLADQFTFLDSSGYPIYYNDYRANFVRCTNNTQQLNCLMRQFKNYYMHYFCTNPKSTLRTGRSSGGLAMDGSFIFRAQLSNDNTQGTTTGITLVCDARRYGIITITDTFVLTKL